MIRIFLLSLLILSSIEAKMDEKFPFVGLSFATETIDITTQDVKHGSGFALRYGQQTQEWRTIFSLEHHQKYYNSFSVEADKILLDDMFGTSKIRPYLGAVVGYMKFDEDALDTSYDETNGFYYGGNFGFILYASDNVDVDISYHYYKVNNLEFLDDLHGATLAIHYFF